jgi:hypothetical protein
MVSKRVPGVAEKPKFEPSELIEHGEADKLTRGPVTRDNPVDGTYTS